jgi:putative ABC transport system permease protein
MSRVARLARAVVARTVWESDAQDAIANLDELYFARLAERGRSSADLWYWGQALTFGPRLWLDPRGRRAPGEVRDRAALAVWGDELRSDVRFALRGFRKSPGFTTAAVSTLAVGIAATTIIYSVVEGAVLRPPAFPDSDRLVWIWPSGQYALTHATYEELEPRIDNGELTAFASRSFALQSGERPDEISGVAVTPNHFAVMGRPPALGRGFSEQDGSPGGEPVALISHELWATRFGADSTIIGQPVELYASAAIPMISGAFTGTAHTVIGVLAPRYRPFGNPVDVVTPLIADPAAGSYTDMGELTMVARLAPGATREQLRGELVVAVRTIPRLESAWEGIAAEDVIDLHTALTGNVRPAMLATLGAVALVLLIACANVANLVLARAQSRRRELGVRAALGADRGRIARQLLTESGVLAIAATLAGVAAAIVLLPTVVSLLPQQLGIAAGAIGIRTSVLAVAASVIALTLVIAGILPALRGTRRLSGALLGNRGGVGRTRHANRAYHGLIIGELAIAAVLASGAGLLLKSFARLTDVDAGFTPQSVLTARVAPSAEEYADADVRRALYDRVLDEVRALPGVESAGAIHFLPVADGGPGVNFLIDPADPESRSSTGYRVVTPGYFQTLGIPIVEGRGLDESDHAAAPLTGLVNQALAERLWPGEDPIGRRLYRTSGQEWFTVVGVTGDVRQSALGLPPSPEAYLPLAQTEWASAMTVVVRANDVSPALAGEIERIIWAVDPDVPITRTASMEDLVSASVASPRFYSVLFSLFAVLALVLGAIGIYGVVSFGVRQRTDEIGIRMALGASGTSILTREIRNAGRLCAFGIALGLAAALVSNRMLGSLLYEVSAFDPSVFGAAAAVLVAVAMGAALGPARRAARVDPLTSIRGD